MRELAELNDEVRELRQENQRLRARLAELEEQASNGTTTTEPRFRDRGDYVEDTRTGLLWQKDGDRSGRLNFYEAAEYASELKLGGLSGWRVPTRQELAAVFPAVEAPFEDTKYTEQPCCKGPHEKDFYGYWTSERDTRRPDYAYVYQWYADGGANNCIASRNHAYVRCVHDPVERQGPEDPGRVSDRPRF